MFLSWIFPPAQGTQLCWAPGWRTLLIDPLVLMDLLAVELPTHASRLSVRRLAIAPTHPVNALQHASKQKSHFGLGYFGVIDPSGHESHDRDPPMSFLFASVLGVLFSAGIDGRAGILRAFARYRKAPQTGCFRLGSESNLHLPLRWAPRT